MTALQIVLSIVLIIVAIAIIVLVLLPESKQQGLGAIAGGADSFFGKNKSRTMEAQLAKFTKIAGTVFFVLSLVSAILILFGV